MHISLVVHGGPQEYGCYVQGNEGVYQDYAQLGGYTGRMSLPREYLTRSSLTDLKPSRIYSSSCPSRHTSFSQASADDAGQ
jgi:hypothetical protein